MTATATFALQHVAGRPAVFASDVREGLGKSAKSLPPRWFYDELGSALFDAICLLPEYYVTRCETEVFEMHAAAIVEAFDLPARIVELGSGTARKTRILLERLSQSEYVPVDIDCATVEKTGRKLVEDLGLNVTAVCGDFTDPAAILRSLPAVPGRTVVLFLGSTIGNLDHDAAAAMLRDVRAALRTGDAFLLGADLRKDARVIEAAYDDALGVTAAFNLNLLQRINRELGGHFDLAAFRHRAVYDEAQGRIEMYLDSLHEQTVPIDGLGLSVRFAEGEAIHTENSHKYTLDRIAALATTAGFAVVRAWTDSRGWFADALLRAD